VRWLRRLGVAAAVLLVFGLQALAVRWLLTAPRFAVATVEVRGASRVSAERVLTAAGIAPGTNIWRLGPDAVAARVAALPEIRRAEVVRELPNRVAILIEERRPFTLVHGGRLHWLDEEGRLLGEEHQAVTPPVPVITGLTEEELASLRTAPSAKVHAAIALIRMLLQNGSALAAKISEIDMSRREGPVLYTVDGIEVRLGTEDWGERLARLEGVLAQVAAQEESVSAIDLRFRDQVVLTRGGQG
jgi:cell division protein FtsQ